MSGNDRWYQDALIYQVRVRSFADSDDDGVGDFPGLTSKLDYLERLGVTALWLLPFYPSPLRDDGYDIADYTAIHRDLGSLSDFRRFLREAHRRGLRVVTELVMNHSSDQHPWFQRARRAPPGSRERDFYVWSDDPTRYADARIIFKDFETSNWTWDPVAKAYYWHRFYSHQPDLNFDNPAVHRQMLRVLDFWFRMGVNGVRLDAIPYLYEREGTSCENLPETHAFLRELRAHVDARFGDRMLLAEANQWPEDAVAYFGKGDECHMAFHFPIMPRLFMALQMETRDPVLDILSQTPDIPDGCQWAIFLRNHDELTLEMVTDEERDYMWRAYARDARARINLGIRHRLAPLFRNNRRRIELMNALLFSLPGTPILYYGDEIGMGDNIYLGDRDSMRTPMQWSPDRNAGFSRANPQRLFLPVVSDPEYSPDAVNVEVQERNPSSLLRFVMRLLAQRRRFQAFGRGSFEPLQPSNRAVLAFVRRFGGECLLVVANLSRNPQYAELDLKEWNGQVPVELFGRNAFPRIGELPYLLTIGPHGFYWFSIEPGEGASARDAAAARPAPAPEELPRIRVEDDFADLFRGDSRELLERVLPRYLRAQRWFRSKAVQIQSVRIEDAVPLGDAFVALVEVTLADLRTEVYALPLAFRPGEAEGAAVARLQVERGAESLEGMLVDPTGSLRFADDLLQLVRSGRRVRGRRTRLVGVPARALRELSEAEIPEATPLSADQSNTAWRHGDLLFGKLFRRVETGASPDLVLSRHLSERMHFRSVPALAGHVEVRRDDASVATLALLQRFVPSRGDAWSYTLGELRLLLDGAATEGDEAAARGAEARVEAYAALVGRLGCRTGEMHVALGTGSDDPELVPEPFTPFARRSFAQAVRNLAVRNLDLLQGRREGLPDEATRRLADGILARRAEIERRTRDASNLRQGGFAIRCHGDYHLGQVLVTDDDFVILDFEGEPARPLVERSRKRSPLADVAGMLRSFHYAMAVVLRERCGPSGGPAPQLEAVAHRWWERARESFLAGYAAAVGPGSLLPPPEQAHTLLGVYELEKALYELGYELNNRPERVAIPLEGLKRLLGGPA